MKRALLAVTLLVAFCVTAGAAEVFNPEQLQDISVTISAGYSQGSGVVFRRDGNTFIWTAAHVVDGLRTEKTITDPKTGTKRTVIAFKDAMVIKHIIEDGRDVGKTEWNARVLKFSEKQDLAILQVRAKSFVCDGTVQFYLDEGHPPVGSDLWHCGSLLGEMGSNSITDGVISQHGRLIDQLVYDQTTATAFPGSSGGGVYLKEDGKYIGMVVRGAGEGFNLIVPVRRMVEWSKKADVYWAIDPAATLPENLEDIQPEDIGVKFEKADTKAFPFLILYLDEFVEAPK